MVYIYENKRGTWYLIGRGKLRFFTKNKGSETALPAIPDGYEVKENDSGMPYLKKC